MVSLDVFYKLIKICNSKIVTFELCYERGKLMTNRRMSPKWFLDVGGVGASEWFHLTCLISC